MELPFVNRRHELAELDAVVRTGGLLVLFGRRRVGKTRLLTQWLRARKGLYSQAIEATAEVQLGQVLADLGPALDAPVAPRTWVEFFDVLDRQGRPLTLCLDEFPYLVAADPSLPSVVQRWLDHRKQKGTALVLAGSSTRMMNDLFLNRGAALYGRAKKLLHVEAMSYRAFCDACRLNPSSADSFTRFSLVGGVPKYWEWVQKSQSPLELAETLFFGTSPALEFEPARLLRDEGVATSGAQALLEVVGRGAERPSEIAARLGTAQTNLSRQFQVLLDAGVLERQLPWGESLRSTKRTSYRLADPTLRFWFRVYSPHRTRWASLSTPQKEQLVSQHAASVFEDQVRAFFPGAGRYWEPGVELDVVAEEREGRLLVGEVKWARLSKRDRSRALADLEARFSTCALATKWTGRRIELFDSSWLATLAAKPPSK